MPKNRQKWPQKWHVCNFFQNFVIFFWKWSKWKYHICYWLSNLNPIFRKILILGNMPKNGQKWPNIRFWHFFKYFVIIFLKWSKLKTTLLLVFQLKSHIWDNSQFCDTAQNALSQLDFRTHKGEISWKLWTWFFVGN